MISVIVPVYKVEKYIRRCVDSILAQTFTDFELILVDDGSPDNCGRICDEYAEKDERIHVIHKENGGLSDARNAGIDWAFANSNSEWITFIDSDDWVHPRYFEGMVEAQKKYGAEIAVSGYTNAEVYSPFCAITDYNMSLVNTEDFFVTHNTIATVAWGKIYRKSFFLRERYPVGKLNEDEFVTYKLLFQNENIAYLDNPMYFYFKNAEGIMKSSWSPGKLDALDAFEFQYNYFKNSPYREAFQCVIGKYIWFLRENYDNLLNYGEVKDKEMIIDGIRKNLRKCIRQNYNRMPVKKNEYLYSIAYPHLIKFYYFKKRIVKRIKRQFSK